VTFGSFHICYHILSLQKPAVYKPAVKFVPLKWKPHRDELLSPVYRRNGYSETPVKFCAMEHTTERTDRRKIKNTASHIVQNHTESYSKGPFLGVKQPERGQTYICCVVKE
jgi:hypothetical protein